MICLCNLRPRHCWVLVCTSFPLVDLDFIWLWNSGASLCRVKLCVHMNMYRTNGHNVPSVNEYRPLSSVSSSFPWRGSLLNGLDILPWDSLIYFQTFCIEGSSAVHLKNMVNQESGDLDLLIASTICLSSEHGIKLFCWRIVYQSFILFRDIECLLRCTIPIILIWFEN
jgi:hypothetical protein